MVVYCFQELSKGQSTIIPYIVKDYDFFVCIAVEHIATDRTNKTTIPPLGCKNLTYTRFTEARLTIDENYIQISVQCEICFVIVRAGRCIITESLSPVPILVGHLVK